jgi:hypothetical protein
MLNYHISFSKKLENFLPQSTLQEMGQLSNCCCLSTLQAKQLVLELSQPVAAICYRSAERSFISKQGKAAAAALLEQLPDVLGQLSGTAFGNQQMEIAACVEGGMVLESGMV